MFYLSLWVLKIPIMISYKQVIGTRIYLSSIVVSPLPHVELIFTSRVIFKFIREFLYNIPTSLYVYSIPTGPCFTSHSNTSELSILKPQYYLLVKRSETSLYNSRLQNALEASISRVFSFVKSIILSIILTFKALLNNS